MCALKRWEIGLENYELCEILPLNWTATKICNLVVNYEKRTQKIQCQLQS